MRAGALLALAGSMTKHWRAMWVGAAWLHVAAVAGAQAAVAPAEQTRPTPADASQPVASGLWQSNDAAWSLRYSVARERLIAGDFPEARRLFDELARSASNANDRALAAELGAMANGWAQRDLAFIRRSDLGESQLHAKAMNQRTSDEIAVLYASAALFGLETGGWLAFQTEPKDAAGGILPALGFAGAAVAAVALVDGYQTLHYGVPQSIASGMYIGLQEGVVWAFWNQARTTRADEWKASTVATLVWGSTAAGALAGGVVGQVYGSTPGRASFVGSAALWSGLVSGLTAGAMFPADGAQDDRALLAGAMGLNIGAVLGAVAAGPVSPSIARVRILDLSAVAGSVVVGGVYWALANRHVDDRAMMGSVALGATGGLVSAWLATQGMTPDRLEIERPGKTATGLSNVSAGVLPTAGGAMLALSGNL
jgi:hypothetical protein